MADRREGGHGLGGALIWPAILGMTYAALPESKAGLAGFRISLFFVGGRLLPRRPDAAERTRPDAL